jgi:hypothetical protein
MPRLRAGLPSTLHATTARPLATREAIGGWRFGGRGGILLPQGELAFKVGDSLRVLIELPAKPFVLVTKPFNFLRLAIRRVARLLIASRSLFAPWLHDQSVRNRYKKYKDKIVPSLRRPELLLFM